MAQLLVSSLVMLSLISEVVFLSPAYALTLLPPPPTSSSAMSSPESSKDVAVVHKTNIFGSDTRRGLTVAKAPWSAIGRVSTPGGRHCSGTLVARDLVLTAAHCLVTKQLTLKQGSFRFDAGYDRGRVAGSARVKRIWLGTYDAYNDRENDWALLKLDWALGDEIGWMPVGLMTKEELLKNRGRLFIAGYASDYYDMERAFWASDCTFRGEIRGQNLVLHDCPSTRGTSGGNLFIWDPGRQNYLLVALHVAEFRHGNPDSYVNIPYSDRTANTAIPSDKFFQLVNRMAQ